MRRWTTCKKRKSYHLCMSVVYELLIGFLEIKKPFFPILLKLYPSRVVTMAIRKFFLLSNLNAKRPRYIRNLGLECKFFSTGFPFYPFFRFFCFVLFPCDFFYFYFALGCWRSIFSLLAGKRKGGASNQLAANAFLKETFS